MPQTQQRRCMRGSRVSDNEAELVLNIILS